MKRFLLEYLKEWQNRPNRKPLIVRGARQVGKTHLIRDFSSAQFDNIAEINFDLTPERADIFASKDINLILRFLETDLDIEIIPGKTLLFLDEIQNVPQLIPLLRYFYEELPELHLIAAGSLLEFTLRNHTFSMPVGRIEYMFMGPMTFPEFLYASNKKQLLKFINSYHLGEIIPQSIHNKLLQLLKIYCVVGGMPAVMKEYINNKNAKYASMEQRSILQTYRDDFSKYNAKINANRLGKVFSRMPHLVGEKLKYVKVDRNERAKDISECIDMLQMAKTVHRVTHSDGNGIPLGAEANHKDFKMLFVDIGLLSSSLGIKDTDIELAEDLLLVNSGAVAEQFAGQHLLYQHDSYIEPELYYWNREKRNSSAEVDYLYAHGSNVIPIEIKAGKAGALKSLHVFASEKNSRIAVRFNTGMPSCNTLKSTVSSKQSEPFQLLSLPLYLVCELERLLNSINN
ncbi:ATP-binding protein [PVC group bacterium]|nr:ATP-binding protein [PVC group bacterium]